MGKYAPPYDHCCNEILRLNFIHRPAWTLEYQSVILINLSFQVHFWSSILWILDEYWKIFRKEVLQNISAIYMNVQCTSFVCCKSTICCIGDVVAIQTDCCVTVTLRCSELKFKQLTKPGEKKPDGAKQNPTKLTKPNEASKTYPISLRRL